MNDRMRYVSRIEYLNNFNSIPIIPDTFFMIKNNQYVLKCEFMTHIFKFCFPIYSIYFSSGAKPSFMEYMHM